MAETLELFVRVAPGASIVAAIRAVRTQRPLRVVVAVPADARSSLDLAWSYADEMLCLRGPQVFHAVGGHYDDFSPVADS
jgi:predicted phosphoribosyltransferase